MVGIDAHLPPVPAHRLHPDALRQRFLMPPQWQPEIAVERRFNEREPAHSGGVSFAVRQKLA